MSESLSPQTIAASIDSAPAAAAAAKAFLTLFSGEFPLTARTETFGESTAATAPTKAIGSMTRGSAALLNTPMSESASSRSMPDLAKAPGSSSAPAEEKTVPARAVSMEGKAADLNLLPISELYLTDAVLLGHIAANDIPSTLTLKSSDMSIPQIISRTFSGPDMPPYAPSKYLTAAKRMHCSASSEKAHNEKRPLPMWMALNTFSNPVRSMHASKGTKDGINSGSRMTPAPIPFENSITTAAQKPHNTIRSFTEARKSGRVSSPSVLAASAVSAGHEP